MTIANKLYIPIAWWFSFSLVWGIYRTFGFPEFFSEVIAKPVIWLGFVWLVWRLKLLRGFTFSELTLEYSKLRPVASRLVFPVFVIICYFFFVNWKIFQFPEFSISLVGFTILVNFMTGFVEEITYRGVLYLWLKKLIGLWGAGILIQVLFLLGHLPILLLQSDSVTTVFVHGFMIVLMSIIYTLIFEQSKSLVGVVLAHGTWNALVYYLLLSS